MGIIHSANNRCIGSILSSMSIRHKLMSIIMLTCIVALAVAGCTFMRYQHISTRRDLVKTLQTQAAMIARNCEAAMVFEEAKEAEGILGAFQAQSSVVFARLNDTDGHILASYQREEGVVPKDMTLVAQKETHLFSHGFLMVSKTVMDRTRNKGIGLLTVWSDLSTIEAIFRRNVLTISMVIMMASLVAYLVSSKVQGIISTPILELTGVVQAVSTGKEYSVRAIKQSDDELGVLTDSFNDMLVQIQARDAVLVSTNEELEARVEEGIGTLKESEHRYKTLLEHIPQKILYKDLNSRYMICNESYARSLNITPEETYGKTDFDFFRKSLAEKYIADDKRIIEKGQPEEMEELHVLNGKAMTVQVLKSPVRNEEGDIIGVFAIFWDITAHKWAERNQAKLNRDLEAMVTELKRSNSELQNFTYVTAHDLKAPLRAIGTLTDWIYADYKGVFDDQGREQMELIKGRVSRMNELINSILRYSQIGRDQRHIRTVDLNILLSETLASIDPPEHITIEIRNTLPILTMEQHRITQIFQNLIMNAIQYIDKDKGLIQIACQDKEEVWEFSVSDNGPGICAQYHEKIFKMFQTLAPRDELESTGIGLAVVKKIVELYGGQIRVESEPGQGSTFYFTLSKESTCSPQENHEDYSEQLENVNFRS
ncbi:MAG: PAS domain-containing protein [Planctomycetes bacterium]|nr:PAS domain-containing protein [Planctomycetota bacterium]